MAFHRYEYECDESGVPNGGRHGHKEDTCMVEAGPGELLRSPDGHPSSRAAGVPRKKSWSSQQRVGDRKVSKELMR